GGAEGAVAEALGAAAGGGWVAPVPAGPPEAAVAAVRAGRARLLMKGQVATPELMRAVLDAASGLRTGRVICQVVLMEVAPAGRRFLLADTGGCIQPTPEQKADGLRPAAGGRPPRRPRRPGPAR